MTLKGELSRQFPVVSLPRPYLHNHVWQRLTISTTYYTISKVPLVRGKGGNSHKYLHPSNHLMILCKSEGGKFGSDSMTFTLIQKKESMYIVLIQSFDH